MNGDHQLHKVRHGRLEIDLPSQWLDESTLLFAAPAKEDASAALSPRAPQAYRSHVTVSVEPNPGGHGSDGYLRAMGAALLRAGLESIERRLVPFRCAAGEGHLVERQILLDGQAIRQWTLALVKGPNVVVATAATSEGRASLDEPVLLGALSSLSFDAA